MNLHGKFQFLIPGIALLLAVVALSSCGVNKEYVQQQISESETRGNAKIQAAEGSASKNSADIAALQGLTNQLSAKTDMALNQAKGFENYQVIWSGVIYYDFDSYKITEEAATILREAGQKMEEVPSSLIEIAGHTDQTGSDGYNLMLGEKRANAAKRFLVDNYGIILYRMFDVSHGKEKPVALPDEMNSHAKNRRVGLKVWGPVQ